MEEHEVGVHVYISTVGSPLSTASILPRGYPGWLRSLIRTPDLEPTLGLALRVLPRGLDGELVVHLVTQAHLQRRSATDTKSTAQTKHTFPPSSSLNFIPSPSSARLNLLVTRSRNSSQGISGPNAIPRTSSL